jgi:hypothetical protein
VYAVRLNGQVLSYRRTSNGVEVTRKNRSPSPGETEYAAGYRSAAEPVKARRLAKPSDCEVGHKGARLHMQGKTGGGGQIRMAPGRRRTTALLIAALLAYNTFRVVNLVPAFYVDVQAHFSLDFRVQGEPVMDGQVLSYRRTRNGVEVTFKNRSPSPGETEYAAGYRSAAEPVRSRATEGNLVACGELETGEG